MGLKIRTRSESKVGRLHPMWGRFGKDNPNFKRNVTKEDGFRLVKHLIGREHTEEQKQRISFALKGKTVSKETREKLRLSSLGKSWTVKQRESQKKVIRKGVPIHNEFSRRKIGESNKGNKSRLWRGGITPINLKIRKSIDYKLWRESVFQRDNYTCQICYIRGGDLQADHIKPFCNFPNLRFDINNGRTLCKSCHKKTETYGRKALKVIN